MVVQEDRLKLLLELTARPSKPSLWREYVKAVVAHREELLKKGGNSGQTFRDFNTRRNELLNAGARQETLIRVAQFIAEEHSAGRLDLNEVIKHLEGK